MLLKKLKKLIIKYPLSKLRHAHTHLVKYPNASLLQPLLPAVSYSQSGQ